MEKECRALQMIQIRLDSSVLRMGDSLLDYGHGGFGGGRRRVGKYYC